MNDELSQIEAEHGMRNIATMIGQFYRELRLRGVDRPAAITITSRLLQLLMTGAPDGN